LLAEAGAPIAVSLRAAAFWGAPLPPLFDFSGIGVPVVFGTCGLFADVASEALAAAALGRRDERNAGAAAGCPGDQWNAAARLASAAFGAPIGALAAGALADLIVLDWRPAVPLPAEPGSDLVLLWAGAPAAWVIVDGVVRIREGRPLGMDEAEIAARAREAADLLLSE
jgi:cytosine/adenosine deaminase-related metal-dependent hydrolase